MTDAERIKELEAENQRLRDAGRNVIAAWDWDEIGQIDDELIDNLRDVVEGY